MNSQTSPFLKTVKLWARSGSLKFAKNAPSRGEDLPYESFSWKGKKLYFRPGTGDADLLHRILLKPDAKREYHFPRDLKPKVILDIGANIGAASLLLREYYPEARIIAFEPEPDNFAVLKLNTQADKNIEIHCVGLSSEDREAKLFLEDDSRNLGGYSTRRFGSEVKSVSTVKLRRADSFLSMLGVHHVDLIKIDTEGAEREILEALDTSVLRTASWICGELHGVDDFELLNRLSPTFNIGIRKSWFSRLSHFEACRKDLSLKPF